jgi:glycosyltransferase involved in cell wall biosynthesis
MTIDLCYVAKNRLEFTQETFRRLIENTDLTAIRNFVIYDDGSTDGTREYLQRQAATWGTLRLTDFGSGVTPMVDFLARSDADFMAKFDNDAMLPPGWLPIALAVMERFPELELLGLECHGHQGDLPHRYEYTPILDGLFLARGSLLRGRSRPVATSAWDGWGQWVLDNKVRAGWLNPSIPVFLLDRVPLEPWQSLTREYVARGWQRPWAQYNPAVNWWSWCNWK